MALRRVPFAMLLAALACGRTQFFDRQLTVSTTSLDFGLTAPGATTARNWITSRKPDDGEAFSKVILEALRS